MPRRRSNCLCDMSPVKADQPVVVQSPPGRLYDATPDVKLECGQPKNFPTVSISYRWYINGSSSPSPQSNSRSFNISRLSFRDKGDYACELEANSVSSDRSRSHRIEGSIIHLYYKGYGTPKIYPMLFFLSFLT